MSRPTLPHTPYEEAIAAIWRDLLGHSDVGVSDDFFEVGGHSLLAPRVVAHIRKTLGVTITVRDFFQTPTVAGLATVVSNRTSGGGRDVGRRPPDAEPVLSFDQERLWLDDQLLPSAAYNVHGRSRLVGPIDVAALEASIRAILVRHESLRTRFPTVAGRPIQVVDEPDDAWHITVADVSHVEHDRAAAARCRLDDEHTRVFDLATGPLFRCLLVKVSDTEHLLSVTVHHIVCDAWSIGLFVRELSALYAVGGDVSRAGLPELPIQFRDYAVWQRHRLTGDRRAELISYWRDHLSGAPPAIALPAARRRLPAERIGDRRLRSALSEEHTAALRGLCRKHGVTSFMVVLAGLTTVLSRWTGQPDVIVGVPVASRGDSGTERLIGFFVNTLPLRVDLSGEPTFAELLCRVRKVALDGYAHADAPLDVIVKEGQVARDPRRTPLFQTILNMHDGMQAERISGVVVEPLETPVPPSKVDVALTAQETGGALHLQFDFNADRFDPAMMQILFEHLRHLLVAVVADPERSLLDYPLAQPAQVAGEPAEGAVGRPGPAIDRYAGSGRVAVVDRSGEWSYRWLARAADRVAHVVTGRGADRVGVIRRPSAAFVGAVLGCVQAGAAFSVIDPADQVPAQYLGVSAILDVEPGDAADDETVDLRALLSEVDGDVAGEATGRAPDPDTGDWAVERLALTGADRLAVLSERPGLLMSALCTAVCAGATLAVADDTALSDPDALTTWLRTNAVSVVYLSPPQLRMLTARAVRVRPPAPRYVVVDNPGELIAHDVVALRRVWPGCRCVGVYRTGRDGRPLATYVVPDDWRPDNAPLRIPLGTAPGGGPIAVRHPSGASAAVGEVAEICAGADRTGDLGRRWADGTLEYAGPAGHDPETDRAETVACLRDAPDVWDAVVTEHVDGAGRTTLIGHLASAGAALDTAPIRPRLVTLLPPDLIPDDIVVHGRLPLTVRGEYDLDALIDGLDGDERTDTYVAPRTPIEKRLTEILEELLSTARIGVHDSFFELGGFSLLATRLTSRIRETFQVEISLRNVFEAQTVDGLARLIVGAQAERSGAGTLEALLDEIAPPAAGRG